MEETTFFATPQYVYDWRGCVKDGVSETLISLYEELFEHAEEVFQFTRIRGISIEILRNVDDALEIHP